MIDDRIEALREEFEAYSPDVAAEIMAALLCELVHRDGFLDHLIGNTDAETDDMVCNEIIYRNTGLFLSKIISRNIYTTGCALYNLNQEDTEELMEHAYSSERCKMNIIKMLTKNY